MPVTIDGTTGITSPAIDLTTPLVVADGGTGTNTLTANNVILGAGTSAVTFVAPGSNGNLLTSNGTTWTSAAAPAGGFSNMTVFTSPGTFTTPATTTKIKVTVVGGGGAGVTSGTPAAPAAGSGGGGGGGAVYVGPVTASTPYAVTVGAAGTVPGGPGGTSSFGPLASSTGGTGGASGTSGTVLGGAGGAGSAGTLLLQGGRGSQNGPISPGGNCFLGSGGQGRTTLADPGTNYGGGGTGGGVNAGLAGGAGAGGVVIVEF